MPPSHFFIIIVRFSSETPEGVQPQAPLRQEIRLRSPIFAPSKCGVLNQRLTTAVELGDAIDLYVLLYCPTKGTSTPGRGREPRPEDGRLN